jgi:hypothetical protein
MSKTRWLIRIVGIVVAVASLATIGYQLWQALPQLRGLEIQVAPAALSLILISLNLALAALLWRNTLQRLGGELPIPTTLYIWFVSQIVRYAPGNVWHLLGRVYLTQQQRIDTRSSSLSMMFELLHVLTSGLLVATVLLLLWWRDTLAFAALLLFPFLVCYLFPQLLHYPLTWIMRRRGQDIPNLHIRRRDLVALLPGYVAVWLIYGGSVYLLTASVYPVSLDALPTLTGMYALAWVLGFLSFITPSGLGVREGILSYMLSFVVPVPVAMLLALLLRVWMTAGELLSTAGAVWLKPKG